MRKLVVGTPTRLPFSPGLLVGNLIFVSGQVAVDPSTGEVVGSDIATQTRQVLDNLAAVLAGAGSTLADVVKTTVFLVSMEDFEAMNRVYAERFPEPRPARSTIGGVSLARPGFRVEIDAIADRTAD